MQKKRILLCNESSFISSGYGVHGKELLTRMHNSGKYEVAELGCYAVAGDPRINNIPWKFYPNVPKSEDTNLLNEYKSNLTNQFGAWRFNKALADFKPHIAFDVRDYWMYSYQEISPYRPYFKWVIMPTVDSAPQHLEWLFTFCSADVVVAYTEWAKSVLLESCGKHINLFPEVALAGVNPNELYPLPNKEALKEQFFGQKDLLITGSVLRNQKRKLVPDLLLAYKQYLNALLLSGRQDIYDRSFLYLHTTFPEEHGWNLPTLLSEYGMLDKTYFTTICRNCGSVEPSKFQNAITGCKKCNNVARTFPSPTSALTTEKLNQIYNMFDLYIQYAICEGFGYPQIEAASCGVPIASVDYSAMTEICNYLEGFPIPVKRFFREMETNADRAYPDNDFTTKLLYQFFTEYSAEQRVNKGLKARELCINKYTWDNVYKVWEECFDSIDISDLRDWNDPTMLDVNTTATVPQQLSKIDFVKYVCENIIKNPKLFDTGHIQMLLRDFQYGLVARGGNMTTLNHQEVVSILEQYLASKVNHEKLRVNSHILKQEDFITCQKK